MHHAQSKSRYTYCPINRQINLVITKTMTSEVKRFPRRERLDVNRGFAEAVRTFDDSFWGNENTMVEDN